MPSLSTGGALNSLGGGTPSVALSLTTPLVFPPFPERTPATGFDAGVNIPLSNSSGSRRTSTIFQVSKAGTISSIVIRTGSSVTTGSSTDVRLETVGADGLPTGTLISAGANGSVTVTNGSVNTNYTATLTTPAAVTQGQLIAVVIIPSSTYSYAISGTNWGQVGGLPYSADWNGTAWAYNSTGVALARLNYNDGSIMRVFGMSNFVNQISAVNFASNTNPNVAGAKFVAPFNGKVIGGWGYFDLDGAVDVELRGENGVTLLTKSSLGANLPPITTPAQNIFYFENEITIERNKTYFYVVKPTTTTAMNIYRTAVVTGAGYTQYSYYTYVNAQNPTQAADYLESVITYPIMGLFFSEITIA